jgi:hypothetical protein
MIGERGHRGFVRACRRLSVSQHRRLGDAGRQPRQPGKVDPFRADFRLPDDYWSDLRLGQTISVTVDALPVRPSRTNPHDQPAGRDVSPGFLERCPDFTTHGLTSRKHERDDFHFYHGRPTEPDGQRV